MRSATALFLLVAALTAVAGGSPAGAGECRDDVFDAAFVADLSSRYPSQLISAEVYDVESRCRYTLNAGTLITTASIRKVEFLAGILLRAQDQGRWLNEWERARAVPMMKVSANQPASDLRTSLGGRARMAQLDRLFGLNDTVATDPWGGTPTTAHDQVKLLRQTVLNRDGLFTQRSVDYMVRLMTHVTGSQRWGIGGGVPHDWTVASKNGFYPYGGKWRANSVGVVTPPEGAGYVIAILSHGWSSMPPGIAAVEVVAKHVAKRLTPGDASCDQPTIEGTSGDDNLSGTSGPDVIAGRGGDDYIFGLGGDDILCGGTGNDVLVGGSGSDTLRGARGDDALNGGSGPDVLLGGAGHDSLDGKNGSDTIRGGAGDDVLFGGLKQDRLQGGRGQDLLFGEEHDDLLIGGRGTDVCDDPGSYERWLVWSGCESR